MFPASKQKEVLPPPVMNLDYSRLTGLREVSAKNLQFGRFNLGCFITLILATDPMKDVNTFAVAVDPERSFVGLELGNFIPVSKFLTETGEWLTKGSMIHVINPYLKCKFLEQKGKK